MNFNNDNDIFISMALLPSFPHRGSPTNHQDRLNQANTITNMYRKYHNASINFLEDEVAFADDGEFLKRIYFQHQYPQKIILLSQYYQYHQELPRLFQKDIHPIIQNYQEEVRGLEYKYVRRKMREDDEEGNLTHRQKSSRPVEKIIKNIELSYYNFEKKSIKKSKEKDRRTGSKAILNRNKKSMPILPFYQYQQKPQKGIQLRVFPQPNKDSRNSCKSKSKDFAKKVSANNSIETPKNLSRSKSKSNLVPIAPTNYSKKPTITVLTQKQPEVKQSKVKSANGSLSKAQSTKNIHERRPLEEFKDLQQRLEPRRESSRKESVKKEPGVKNMFKKVVQAKKMIKLNK